MPQFINLVLGQDSGNPVSVAGGPFLCTKTVKDYSYVRKDGLTISLVDTPGFNNFGEASPTISDSGILQMMTDFLEPK